VLLVITFIQRHNEKDAIKERREELAYLYGWRLIILVGAKRLVSKEMWKEHHIEIS